MCSPFDALPVELLDNLFDQLWRVSSTKHADLKALQISVRSFTNLGSLLKLLFKTVFFRLDGASIHLADSDQLASLEKYVHTAVFVEPRYSMHMDFELFQEIYLHQVIEEQMPKQKRTPRRTYKEYFDQEMHQILPLSAETMSHEYDKYMLKARAVKDLASSEEIRVAWSNALHTLNRIDTIWVTNSYWKSCFDEGQHFLELHRHLDTSMHTKTRCHQIAAPMGDMLLAIVIDSLSRSHLQVSELSIGCTTTGCFRWPELQGWAELSLAGLQNVVFEPQCSTQGRADWLRIEGNAVESMDALLSKCCASLATLGFDQDCPILWPSGDTVALPALRSLYMEDFYCNIDTAHFRKWLLSASSLEEIELRDTSTNDWPGFFSAFKEYLAIWQPSKLLLKFTGLDICARAELSLYQDMGSVQSFRSCSLEGPSTKEHLKVTLIRFMAGFVEWDDPVIEEWFDQT